MCNFEINLTWGSVLARIQYEFNLVNIPKYHDKNRVKTEKKNSFTKIKKIKNKK